MIASEHYEWKRSGRHSKRLDALLLATVNMLAKDEPLLRRYRSRSAANGMITATATSDPVLIYRKRDDTSLESGSARIASLAYSGRHSPRSSNPSG
jgi:hypothetical protein